MRFKFLILFSLKLLLPKSYTTYIYGMKTFPFLWCRSFGCFDDAKLETKTHTEVKIPFIYGKICYMKQILNVMNE